MGGWEPVVAIVSGHMEQLRVFGHDRISPGCGLDNTGEVTLLTARLRILDGQTHEVSPEVLAPVLVDFFLDA